MDIIKTETDIPLLDNVVYYTKLLVLNSIVKEQEKADLNETVESLKNSDIYIMSMEKTCSFEMFTYTKEQLDSVGLVEQKYLDDKNNVPLSHRPTLMEMARLDYIKNYIDLNNYYRMLNGLPDNGDKGIYIDYVPDIPPKYLHEMTADEIYLLQNNGELATIMQMYPDKKYINFLGDKKIEFYKARKADMFDLLYYPEINITEVTTRFIDNYEKNKTYTLISIYNKAYKNESDYFDNFIVIFIKIQTFIDMITSIPDYVIKKELFDIKSIKYLFESNGIEFFEDIPLRYQISMMKNMNQLLEFKSTTKSMIDICSIFGFDNIEIFKYYILRERIQNENGEYEFYYKEIEENGVIKKVEDVEREHELKFVKVPIEEELDNYIRDTEYHVAYDEMTSGDTYWTGDRTAEEVKKEILNHEFNILRSKYISIDTIYAMDKLTFEMSYMFNMIFDDVNLEDNLYMYIFAINTNTKFKLRHVFFYLYTLLYEDAGLKDSIFDTPTKIMTVRGFNFNADLSELSSYIQNQGFTMEELGIDFEIPDSGFLSPSQLINNFIKNRACYDHVVKQLLNAQTKRIYDIYKHIYDALMITEISDRIYTLNDGSIATTYTEYFKEKDPIIYYHLLEIRRLDEQDKKTKIQETISDIIFGLDDYFRSEEFDFLFSNIPSISSEIIRGYMIKVINFYKSYKINLDKINTIYKFDSKLDNSVKVFDDIFLLSKNIFIDNVDIEELTYFISIMNIKDNIKVEDYVKFMYLVSFMDKVEVKDKIHIDIALFHNVMNTFEFDIDTYLNSLVKMRDKISIHDEVYINNI